LACDLYELDDELWTRIEKTVHQRDSIINVDTLAAPPRETFLQTLYKRKQKVLLASQAAMNIETSTSDDRDAEINR
jgi:hypothetical protein